MIIKRTKSHIAEIFCNVLCVFVITVVSVNAQKLNDDFFSPKSRLSFGNYLFLEKDYLRASNEYKEFLKTDNNDTVRFKLSESFLRIGRYEEAANNFKSLFFSTSLTDEARLGLFKSLFFEKNFVRFRQYRLEENYTTEKFSHDIDRLNYISYFFDSEPLPDSSRLFSAFADLNRADIKKFYYMKKNPDTKNPVTAALLSAAIPGLGKIYTGEIGDGITSLITTGLLVFLSANNFRHDHNFRGWLFAGFAALAYGGNIYGSAASAQIYNAGVKFNFDNEVKLFFEKHNYFLPEFDFVNR
ncbi:MAG: hypothetical protein HYS25_00510 [Ignavibacteriales bacterium]|nr:hypothetical protein [Ignavibacteriales bacterium]